MNTKLRHVGIVIQEVDVWLDFLVNNLDFEIWNDQIESGTFVSQLIAIPQTTVRTIKLKDKYGGVIELLYFKSPPAETRSHGDVKPNSLGLTHIALQVDSVDQKLEKLAKIGLHPFNPATISVDGQAKVCYLHGPEKVLFELVELLK